MTAAFVSLLYMSLTSLRKARWHLLVLGLRSMVVITLAVVGMVSKSRLVREAQVDMVMTTSMCFLVVRSFRSLVFAATPRSITYPSRRGHDSRTRRSTEAWADRHTATSQERIHRAESRGSGEGEGGIGQEMELDEMSAANSYRSVL